MKIACYKAMKDDVVKIRISDIYLDESIYPRENIDHSRSRQAVDSYIADLRATTLLELDLRNLSFKPAGYSPGQDYKETGHSSKNFI